MMNLEAEKLRCYKLVVTSASGGCPIAMFALPCGGCADTID